MSLSIGIPNAAGVTIGGKSAATIQALSDADRRCCGSSVGYGRKATATKSRPALWDWIKARARRAETPDESNQSVAVKVLLKRMQELQQQLREQQQQLAAAQAASYPTPEAKATVVMAIQGQIADTNGALLEVSAALVKELAKGSSTGTVVNTTA